MDAESLFSSLLFRLFGFSGVEHVDRVALHLAAIGRLGGWPGLVAIALLAVGLAAWLYGRCAHEVSPARRAGLLVLRLTVLVLMVAMLAHPELRVEGSRRGAPTIVWLLDNSDSMHLPHTSDDQAGEVRRVGEQTADDRMPSRLEVLRQWWRGPGERLRERLTEVHQAKHEVVVFSGPYDHQIRVIGPRLDAKRPPVQVVLDSLSGSGESTSLSAAFQQVLQLGRRQSAAAIVVMSDFGHNDGPSPLQVLDPATGSGADGQSPPVFAVGLGPMAAKDLAVEIVPPARMKRGERSTVQIKLAQYDLDGQTVEVRIEAQQVRDGRVGEPRTIRTQSVMLEQPVRYLQIPITLEQAGEVRLTAVAARLPGEALVENNQSSRDITVVDDFLRITYVAHEPNWEWRFMKEVFHRDRLVGMRGFRTYLNSSAPRVREANPLFLQALATTRSEFFETDVLFLGDVPPTLLSDRFCRMAVEFVEKFGGGLVIVAGPRFGPGHLAQTPLAATLPVVLSPRAESQPAAPFLLQLTDAGRATPFMQLGDPPQDPQEVWNHLEGLRWYHPVERLHPLAVALAVHPQDRGVDGQPQPLIASRRVGLGEVVYIAFDETWRLRRGIGEKYYRQFWSQLINHLALGRPLGADKRFVVKVDRPVYSPGEWAAVEVQAYDAQFQPLGQDEIPADGVTAELLIVPDTTESARQQQHVLSFLGDGRFTMRLPIETPGFYRLRVRDPLTGKPHEASWRVASGSAERQSPRRNQQLQQAVARTTAGKALELEDLESALEQLAWTHPPERFELVKPLWESPLWFMLIVGLVLAEWSARYRWHLP